MDFLKKIGDLEKSGDKLEKRKDALFKKRMDDYEKSVFSDFKFEKDDREIVQTEKIIDEINKQIEIEWRSDLRYFGCGASV